MKALVVTHGGIGLELVGVVEQIMGPVPGLRALSNRGKSAQDITEAIRSWLAEPAPGVPGEAGKSLLFIDDYGGSCATASQLASGPDPDVAIISGVNLAMLLGYVTWRETTEFKALVRRLVDKGREAIAQVGAR